MRRARRACARRGKRAPARVSPPRAPSSPPARGPPWPSSSRRHRRRCTCTARARSAAAARTCSRAKRNATRVTCGEHSPDLGDSTTQACHVPQKTTNFWLKGIGLWGPIAASQCDHRSATVSARSGGQSRPCSRRPSRVGGAAVSGRGGRTRQRWRWYGRTPASPEAPRRPARGLRRQNMRENQGEASRQETRQPAALSGPRAEQLPLCPGGGCASRCKVHGALRRLRAAPPARHQAWRRWARPYASASSRS